MQLNTLALMALAGTLATLPAVAAETPIDIKTDLDGQYYLVEKGGTAELPTLVVNRAYAGENDYVKREFDCAANTVRYLGQGASLEEMQAAEPSTEAAPMEPGTIPDQLSRLVCPQR